ncbi:DNA recombination protein RmuC [Nesterenkonia alba]|uniref:DNA recombination protein RmuC n=1 Tax=Nesterenkonia alba TaxID=515814 RepID=UPI0003B6D9FA|nr:DNA recombination protein RmuC [Nesterenkonia alba]
MSPVAGTVDAMEWMQLVTGLVLGGVLGAGLLWFLLRDRMDQVRSLQDQLSASEQQLAAARGRLEEVDRERSLRAEAEAERESLLELLHPVRQGVTEVQRRVAEMERHRAAEHSQLAEQLTAAARTDAHLMETTHQLLSALHSTSARGHWGEVQLRRVVEAAGMLPHVDFLEQHSATGAEGQSLRPDLVVRLPGGRHLVIDAKAPLHPEDPAGQARALRARIHELSQRKYWQAVERSPEVVFCFLPAESLLGAALEADAGLLDDAVSRGVTVVSPASLLAALKAVEAAWRQEHLMANAAQLIDHSRDLYRRLARMGEHLQRTGQRLRQTVDAYNGLLGNLERQVLPKVETMSRLQVTESSEGSGDHLDALSRGVESSAVELELSPLGPRLTVGAQQTGEPESEGSEQAESSGESLDGPTTASDQEPDGGARA